MTSLKDQWISSPRLSRRNESVSNFLSNSKLSASLKMIRFHCPAIISLQTPNRRTLASIRSILGLIQLIRCLQMSDFSETWTSAKIQFAADSRTFISLARSASRGTKRLSLGAVRSLALSRNLIRSMPLTIKKRVAASIALFKRPRSRPFKLVLSKEIALLCPHRSASLPRGSNSRADNCINHL